jgi:hypothetical protein
MSTHLEELADRIVAAVHEGLGLEHPRMSLVAQ